MWTHSEQRAHVGDAEGCPQVILQVQRAMWEHRASDIYQEDHLGWANTEPASPPLHPQQRPHDFSAGPQALGHTQYSQCHGGFQYCQMITGKQSRHHPMLVWERL